MADQPRFREGDLVDVVFRRAVVESVHSSGRLVLVHVEEEFHGMDPDAPEVEVTVVGRVDLDKFTNGWRMHEAGPKHLPERRGSDSEGYGACTGCGDLWPCAGYRKEAQP